MFDSQTLVTPHPVLYKLGCNVCRVELFDILMYSSIICRYAKHNNDHTLPMRRHAVCQLVPWRIPAHSFMGLGWKRQSSPGPLRKFCNPLALSRSLSRERSWRESEKSTSNNLVSWWCCVNRCRLVYPSSFSRAHLHTEKRNHPTLSHPTSTSTTTTTKWTAASCFWLIPSMSILISRSAAAQLNPRSLFWGGFWWWENKFAGLVGPSVPYMFHFHFVSRHNMAMLLINCYTECRLDWRGNCTHSVVEFLASFLASCCSFLSDHSLLMFVGMHNTMHITISIFAHSEKFLFFSWSAIN